MSIVEEIVAKIIATIVAKDLQPILEQDRARWNCAIKQIRLTHASMENTRKIMYDDQGRRKTTLIGVGGGWGWVCSLNRPNMLFL